MKKNFMYAMMGAIALVGAGSFSACQSSDEIIDNPDYNPETKTVKTAITMNVGRGGEKTRMTATVTQNGQPFRGMFDVFIYPAALDGSAITTGSNILDPVISNETMSGITATASNTTYAHVQVLVGTDNFLFYGRAGTTAPNPSAGTLAAINATLATGYTVPTFPTASTTTAGISFAAQQIAATTADGWTEPVGILLPYLNSIKTALGTTALSSPKFESLRLDFIKAGVPRAGSAEAVLATVNRMYDLIGDNTTGFYATLSADEQTKATAVKTAITTAPGKLSGSDIVWDGASLSATYQTFPANLGLPLGAAQYQYNTTNAAFEYITGATPSVANTPVNDYIYPSELFYFTNTPLKETSGSVTWPNTTGNWAGSTTAPWNAAATTSNWTGTVQASSKNIALVNNVQYGTAQLATYVQSVPVEGKLYDNSKDKDPEATENQAITYSANMFPLTGVLIGTQPATVGWNFLPTGSCTKCIYDNTVSYSDLTDPENPVETPIYANSTAYSGPNYTLVYDNDGYTGDGSGSVNVCLEFTNNSGVDFYGKDGVIKDGQKFYLIGTLNPTSESKPAEFPTAVGSSNAIYYPSVNKRVFIQDYTTTAKFQINAGSATTKGSLAYALSSIPDLKAVNQEIGLSVDLNWTPGLQFDDVPLGQ